jgi:hypothetical protein
MKVGMHGHSIGYQCTSQEMDANALAKAMNPKMQLCLRWETGESYPGFNAKVSSGMPKEWSRLCAGACTCYDTTRMSLAYEAKNYQSYPLHYLWVGT